MSRKLRSPLGRTAVGLASTAVVLLLGLGLPATASAAQHSAPTLTCTRVPAHMVKVANLSSSTTFAWKITPVSGTTGARCPSAVARLYRAAEQAYSAARSAAARTSSAAPSEADECYNPVGIKWLSNYGVLQGYSYFKNCTGTLDPGCSVVADLQELSNTDGSWFTIKEGPSKFGACNSSTESVASIDCTHEANNYTYHTLAIISIFWANGTAVLGAHDYSSETTHKSSC